MSKTAKIVFRATADQARRLEQLSNATGLNSSEVLRGLIDSAALVSRPVVMSNFTPLPVSSRELSVQHGT